MENSDLDGFGRLCPDERGDAGEYQAGGDGNEFQKLASVHGSILGYRMPDGSSASGFKQSLCHAGSGVISVLEERNVLSDSQRQTPTLRIGSLILPRKSHTPYASTRLLRASPQKSRKSRSDELIAGCRRFLRRKEPDCPAIILFRYSDCETSGFSRTRTTTSTRTSPQFRSLG